MELISQLCLLLTLDSTYYGEPEIKRLPTRSDCLWGGGRFLFLEKLRILKSFDYNSFLHLKILNFKSTWKALLYGTVKHDFDVCLSE